MFPKTLLWGWGWINKIFVKKIIRNFIIIYESHIQLILLVGLKVREEGLVLMMIIILTLTSHYLQTPWAWEFWLKLIQKIPLKPLVLNFTWRKFKFSSRQYARIELTRHEVRAQHWLNWKGVRSGEDGSAPAPLALKWDISLRIQMTGKHAKWTTKDDERLQPIPPNREQQNNKLKQKPRIVSPLRKRMKCYKTLKT